MHQAIRQDHQETLFPTDLPTLDWAEFRADGFSELVSGLVHRAETPAVCGMPLGGIDTGCIDLETSGLLGYCTIFNSLYPRRSIHHSFLGLAVGGKAMTLTTHKLPKVDCARDIHYWGHYPIADLEYDLDSPVSVGLRAWSPFVPGDVATSSIPAAVFEVRLRNSSRSRQMATLAMSFSGPITVESNVGSFAHQMVRLGPGEFSGVLVAGFHHGQRAAAEITIPRIDDQAVQRRRDPALMEVQGNTSYMLGVLGNETIGVGGELAGDGLAWSRIASELPLHNSTAPGVSVSVNFSLEPGEAKSIRFVLAWHSPQWSANGTPNLQGDCFSHMYAARFGHVSEVVELLIDQHASLLRQILSWQQVIYSERSLPAWLRDQLVNILHLITEGGVWAQAKPPLGDWCKPEDGLFAMNESPRMCPQMECVPCTFYGNLPLVIFFPALARSTLRAFKAYQFEDGSVPFIFGGICGRPGGMGAYELAKPARAYQTTTNGPSYVAIVDRYWHCTGDGDFLREFYPSVKKSTQYTMSLNRGPDGVISMPDRIVSEGATRETEWIETAEWAGMTVHVGGIHLASLAMTLRMAEAVGDADFALQCRSWLEQGTRSMEEKMWNGRYYLNSWEPQEGIKSDLVLSCQLDGDWMTLTHGLPRVFRPDRAKIALETIKSTCVRLSPYGVVFFAQLDGSVAPTNVGYGPYGLFLSETLMVGMTYMYAGQRDTGLEICHRLMDNVVRRQRLSWDMPCILNGDTGSLYNGNDYGQALILWTLPAAIGGQSVAEPTRPGGLVYRMIEAGRDKRDQASERKPER